MAYPAAVMKRLAVELSDLVASPPEGIRVLLNEAQLTDVRAEIEGPAGTPFEGGLFQMRLCLPADFPASPPKGLFVTKIFHPNVSTSGDICVNVLKRDWTSETTLRHVLMVIRCLLIQPFPDSALNEEAGKLLLEEYDEYDKRARLMTNIHAMCLAKRGPTPLTASGANAGGTSSADTHAGKKDKEGGAEGSSPTLKKAKSDNPKAAAGAAANSTMAKVKKGLKRL
ncbi:hypothetical protein HYH03_004262 [Edaphochlamys debaryana]|uniref:E2 ubiquitin-conjugating enzyme n=1 Tax=Edaphochlamys debaryana TaxID=47281 RepID=A0A835Y8F7_9CHLO|nr:hypothetical protein HYH03_004262 [Edaphochlamys debaryana]|eukprot:KAG2498003.1 hypothetical protein HYH03_004262 [Edaphochlamys debaryana]